MASVSLLVARLETCRKNSKFQSRTVDRYGGMPSQIEIAMAYTITNPERKLIQDVQCYMTKMLYTYRSNELIEIYPMTYLTERFNNYFTETLMKDDF